MSWQTDISWKATGPFVEPVNRPLQGRAVAIVGGGPGLTLEHATHLKHAERLILVNNSYLLFPETPHPLFARDRRWWQWHGGIVAQIGHLPITASRPGANGYPPGLNIYHMQLLPEVALTQDRARITGKNSGHGAIQLAVHLGASRIYLAGFDMGFKGSRTHWHAGHAVPASQSNYEIRFRPALEAFVEEAATLGITIEAITPTQANIPAKPFDLAMEDLQCQPEQLG